MIHLILLAIVIAGAVGILLVVMRQCGVSVPPFIVTIFWICVAVVLGVLAVKYIAGML